MSFTFLLKTITASAFLCLAFFRANAQQIILSGGMESGRFEYSGLTVYANRELWLLPQHADKIKDSNVSKIQTIPLKKIKNGKHLTFAPKDFQSIEIIDPKHLLDVKKSEGFEAITCVGQEVYLSMETTSETEDSCFLFKGSLHKNVITLSERMGLPHLKNCNNQPVGNAGYESLTYLPKEKKLLAIYEYEGEAKKPIGFKLDLNLKKATPVYLDKPLCFRITDIQATKSGGFFGVNVCYEGTMKDDRYLACHCTSDNRNVTAVVEEKTRSFAQIISFTPVNDSTYHWEHFRNIDPSMPVNWEGLAIVGDHFVLINDTNNSQNKKNPNSTTYFISVPEKRD